MVHRCAAHLPPRVRVLESPEQRHALRLTLHPKPGTKAETHLVWLVYGPELDPLIDLTPPGAGGRRGIGN